MKRVAAIAVALAVVAGVSFAQQEANQQAEKPKKEAVAGQQGKEMARPGRAAAMEQAWKDAGCSDEEIAKLKDLHKQWIEARKAKDQAKADQAKAEIDKIFTPERQAKLKEARKAMREKAAKAKDAETTK
jgi:hypothetical protein